MKRVLFLKNWVFYVRRLFLLALICVTFLLQPASSRPAEAQLGPSASAPAQVFGVAVGAHIRPSIDYGDRLNNFNAEVNKNSAILMWFSDWQGFDPFLLNVLHDNATTQPTIMITWYPGSGRKATGCSRDFNDFIGYNEIIVGECDGYISNFARSIAARPERFLIRFAHEMNIRDWSYWPGHFGFDASAYVNMYRHVYDVFMAAHRNAGGNNVEWVWSPNYFSNPAQSWNYLHNYYPGDDYVDWIGLSGFNFYPASGQPNRSFMNLYGDVDGTDAYYTAYLPGVLYDLACHYAKPVILAEFGAGGTSNTAANKANWISDAYARIPNYPFVRAVVWFNDFAGASNTNVDLRVTNINPPPNLDASVTQAYKNAISPSVYKSSLPSAASVTPPSTYCGNGMPVFSVSPLKSLAVRGGSTYHTLLGMLYNTHPTVSFPNTPSGLTVQLVNDQLNPPWGQARIHVTVGANVANGTYSIPVSVNSSSFTIQVQVVNQVVKNFFPILRR